MLLALLANGLLRHSGQLYALSNGFHGLASIFLLLAQVGGLNLLGTLSELEVTQYEHKQEQQKETLDHLSQEIATLKLQRKNTPHHVPASPLPEADRFSRLLPERKLFIETIKMISYRAETSMASPLHH